MRVLFLIAVLCCAASRTIAEYEASVSLTDRGTSIIDALAIAQRSDMAAPCQERTLPSYDRQSCAPKRRQQRQLSNPWTLIMTKDQKGADQWREQMHDILFEPMRDALKLIHHAHGPYPRRVDIYLRQRGLC